MVASGRTSELQAPRWNGPLRQISAPKRRIVERKDLQYKRKSSDNEEGELLESLWTCDNMISLTRIRAQR